MAFISGGMLNVVKNRYFCTSVLFSFICGITLKQEKRKAELKLQSTFSKKVFEGFYTMKDAFKAVSYMLNHPQLYFKCCPGT